MELYLSIKEGISTLKIEFNHQYLTKWPKGKQGGNTIITIAFAANVLVK